MLAEDRADVTFLLRSWSGVVSVEPRFGGAADTATMVPKVYRREYFIAAL